MYKNKVFDILGIVETRNTDMIKKAYRGKLVQVNPEDNPEGFKLLREAYEEAIRLSYIEEEEPDKDTPVSRWIKKAEGVYKRLSSRIDAARWKDLFDEEIFRDFDTAGEARDAFIEFLMDHFRLPAEIWQLIDDTFQLVESKEELLEKFPEEFVNFITRDAEGKSWMDYTLFEGDDEGDIDEFISIYLSLRRMNENRQYDGVDEAFEKLEPLKLWHPYLEAEKIRYFMAQERLEDAGEVAANLREKDCRDLYAKYYIAELYLKSGDLENAYAECMDILEADSDYFGARVLLCTCYLEKGEYRTAKEGYLDLLEISNYNESLNEGLHKANEGLINILKEQLEREPDNKSLKMELAWCYYQNSLFKECAALTESLELDDEIYYDYNNLMSRTYLELEDFEKGFPCVKKWLEEILKTQEDGTKETRKRLQRLGLAYYLKGICYYHFGMEKEDKKEDINQCIKYIDLAAEAENNTGNRLQYMTYKAQILLKLKEEKSCIDVCDGILKIDRGYFPAYLIRQEAYFNLRMAQEVIDDYYNAVEIYAGNPSLYIFAARVYQIYRQYENAAGLFKRAREAGVESNELLFLELKNRRLKAENNEERKRVAPDLYNLYTRTMKEPGDLNEPADILHERALCYYYADEDKLALKAIENKLEVKKSEDSMMLKGDILYHLKEYKKAAAVFKEVLRENPDYAEASYKAGLCYNALGMEEEALYSYLKAVKDDPEHPYVNSELMEIYKKRYLKNFKKEDYNTALTYAKRQVELNPNVYYYTDLGLMYLDGYDMKEGIKAFEEAIKYDDANGYPYNNIGYVYKVLGDFDRAYEYYKMAIDRIGTKDLLPHWNMGVYYRSMGQFEKALETYKMIDSISGNPALVSEKILEVYKQMGAWDRALQQAKRLLQLKKNWLMEYQLECGDIYSFAGKKDEALGMYERAMKEFFRKSKPYIKMGSYMLWVERNRKKALKYYMKAYKIARSYDTDSEKDALQAVVSALKELGKEKKGVKYVEQIYELHRGQYGSIDDWLNNPDFRKVRLYYLAVWSYNIGRYEEARNYIGLMKKTLNCTHCTYCTCYEYMELEGRMLELQKDYIGALERYQRALSIAPDNIHYYTKIKELKEKAEVR